MADRARSGSVMWGLLPLIALGVLWGSGYRSPAPLLLAGGLAAGLAGVAAAGTPRAVLVAVSSAVAVILVMFGAMALVPSPDRSQLDLAPPIGSVIAYAGGNAEMLPAGWLLCDGRELNVRDNPELFAALAFTHGGLGDTFRLPDLRGRFLRGVDGDANRDPDRERRMAPSGGGNVGNRVGSVQEDALAAHDHEYRAFVLKDTDWTRGVQHPLNGTGDVGSRSTRKEGGAESRPKNAYVQWIVRAR